MKRISLLCALLAAATCVAAQAPAPVPAGAYTLDKAHASLIFRVNHIGFSNYTRRFKRFDAKLQFDPANMARSSVTVSVDATSLETDYPSPEKLDFNALLQNEQWLDTAKFPQMTFRSSKVEVTAPSTLKISGDLTLRGVTRPMVLDATYNGGYEGHPLDPTRTHRLFGPWHVEALGFRHDGRHPRARHHDGRRRRGRGDHRSRVQWSTTQVG